MQKNIELKTNWAKDLVTFSNGLTRHYYMPNLVKSTQYLYTELESMFSRFVEVHRGDNENGKNLLM
jgi:hypothetical protein